MRILFCLGDVPSLPLNGFHLAVHHLVVELLARGHEVRVLALDRAGRPPSLPVPHRVVPGPRRGRLLDAVDLGRSVLRREPLRVHRATCLLRGPLREELSTFRPDVVHVSDSKLARLGAELDGHPAVLACLDAEHRNVEAEIRVATWVRRLLLHAELQWNLRFEATELARFTHLTAVTGEDARALSDLDPRLAVTVVPNGVHVPDVARRPPAGAARLLLHGAMKYAPNVLAARLLAEEVLPRVRVHRADVTLDIVGRHPAAAVRRLATLPSVRVHGEVPSLDPWMTAATAYVCPMVSGTGIKNKLLEAMAYGVPCVATPLALQGIRAVDGEDLLVGASPDDLASQVLRVLDDPRLADELGRNGRMLVRRDHSWAAVAGTQVSVYEAAVRAVADRRNRTGIAGQDPQRYGLADVLLGPGAIVVPAAHCSPKAVAGRAPRPVLWSFEGGSESSLPSLALAVARREVLVARARRHGVGAYHVQEVHRRRAVAAQPRPDRLLASLRRLLRDDVAVALVCGEGARTPVEAVRRRAGLTAAGPSTVTAGDVVIQPVRRGATPAILRLGVAGCDHDPRRGAAVLELLADGVDRPVPRLLDSGVEGVVAWTLETRLPGSVPRDLDASLFRDVVQVTAAFPTVAAAPASRGLEEDRRSLQRSLSTDAGVLHAAIAPAREILLGHPAVLGHGDLWRGNLLAAQGRLSGIVDWDGWQPATAPGVDLLQLHATAWRHQRGLTLGDAWLRRPWAMPSFRARTTAYWEAVGVVPSGAYLDAIAVAWWAREVAGTLRRYPRRGRDAVWLDRNVAPVLAELGAGAVRRPAG